MYNSSNLLLCVCVCVCVCVCGGPSRGRYLVALGRSWHPEEFTCSQCKVVLEEGGFFEERGAVYCTKCYDNRYAPNCAKCKKKIAGVSKRLPRPSERNPFQSHGLAAREGGGTSEGSPMFQSLLCQLPRQKLCFSCCCSCNDVVIPAPGNANWHTRS